MFHLFSLTLIMPYGLVLATDEDFILGVTHIPPIDTRFYKPSEIDQFIVEITNMCVSNK